MIQAPATRNRRLCRRVTEQQHHRRLDGQCTAHSQQERQHAQGADRRVGEDALEIGLHECQPRADQHRGRADRTDGRNPEIRATQRGAEPCQQVHAGLDHRGRVQVRAHRCRRFHRTGQPEVKRELR